MEYLSRGGGVHHLSGIFIQRGAYTTPPPMDKYSTEVVYTPPPLDNYSIEVVYTPPLDKYFIEVVYTTALDI